MVPLMFLSLASSFMWPIFFKLFQIDENSTIPDNLIYTYNFTMTASFIEFTFLNFPFYFCAISVVNILQNNSKLEKNYEKYENAFTDA
jgi:hypothetical protein